MDRKEIELEQEIFDKVKEHALQGMRSVELGCCMYRGLEGRKCFVGVLIPDELYDSSFEGKQVSMLPKGVLPACSISLLQDLQRIHDTRDVEEWPKAFDKLATHRGLRP